MPSFPRLRRPRFLFTDTASVWQRQVVGKDAAGSLIFEWVEAYQSWPCAINVADEQDVLTFRELGIQANYIVYFWRNDAGQLPVVKRDDHVTFADAAGRVHTAVVKYNQDMALANVHSYTPCEELTEEA